MYVLLDQNQIELVQLPVLVLVQSLRVLELLVLVLEAAKLPKG